MNQIVIDNQYFHITKDEQGKIDSYSKMKDRILQPDSEEWKEADDEEQAIAEDEALIINIALMNMILACFKNGIEVDSPQFLASIEATLQEYKYM